MCGVTGFYSLAEKENNANVSLQKIKHRGPDSIGLQLYRKHEYFVGLGHVRLSVMDLSRSADQPMVSSDGCVVMVFNGEIYNFKQLKSELPGYDFRNHSDSEVLLEYYCRFGADGFAHVRGMFAVAFYNLKSGELVLVRDQIGVKPIYYCQDNDGVYFSSEVRGLRPYVREPFKIDPSSLYEFLSCGFVYEPDTGLEGVKKVPAGHYVTILGKSLIVRKYFDLEFETRSKVFDSTMVKAAVESQLDSDVKLGTFFSGGLDSSIIAAYARTTAIFANYNKQEILAGGGTPDQPYALGIAAHLGIELETTEIESEKLNIDETLDSMKRVAEGNEELISDYTFLASLELSKGARAKGFKVMLSGMGGDETFVGYPRYNVLIHNMPYFFLAKLSSIPTFKKILRRFPGIAKKIERLVSYYEEGSFVVAYSRLLGYFSGSELEQLLGVERYEVQTSNFTTKLNPLLKDFEYDNSLVKGLVLDYHGFLSHNLSVADKSSMQVGLELRVPLLDQDLYTSYLSGLRTGAKTHRVGKVSLTRLLVQLVPRKFVCRKKAGFNPPLDGKILAIGELKIISIFRSGVLYHQISQSFIEEMVNDHFKGLANNTYKIWQLLYLHFWLATLE
jgi:asparagine synthase (glutamine-hydrolysing)